MDRATFDRTTAALARLARDAAALPLDEYVTDIGRDDAFGCFVDSPIAWSSRRDMLAALRNLAIRGSEFARAGFAATESAIGEIAKAAQREDGSRG